MTSVKDFRVVEEPTEETLGSGFFVFTDAYSVFDWGPMPDAIPSKGNSLCVMGAATFESLEAAGIPTHYQGVTPDATSLDACSAPPNEMAIELTQVPDLPYTNGNYEYEAYHAAAGENYLIPLEIIFRNQVPIGSSLRRRSTPAEHGLTWDAWPDTSVALDTPIVEFSTKYEESDRYLEPDEVETIAGAASVADLRSIAHAVNDVISAMADAAGMVHLDGKIECLYHQGDIRVADVAGTFDENRFSYQGTQLSKECIRQYYRAHDPAWVAAMTNAKQEAKKRDIVDWRTICESSPMSLPASVIETVQSLYTAGANAYIGYDLFDAPPIDQVVLDLEELQD